MPGHDIVPGVCHADERPLELVIGQSKGPEQRAVRSTMVTGPDLVASEWMHGLSYLQKGKSASPFIPSRERDEQNNPALRRGQTGLPASDSFLQPEEVYCRNAAS
jgi:hypothetical protein